MDTTHILQVAGKYISGISEVQDNIYKGTLTVADKPAGIYFFDLNNQPVEDFESYQERLLAEEFYAHPGNLQWNYYLFLLNDQLGTKVKQDIEKNDKYARKYVLTQTEFDDFFTLEKSDAAIRPNIVSEWKRKLDEVGLQDVYSLRSYVDLVNQFKTSGSAPPKRIQPARAADDEDKIRFINRLVLKDNYRPFPVQRDFIFGKVNLFRGINGVGKTSLFEAIEAMICGKCLRNPSTVIPHGCIEAQFNNRPATLLYDGGNSRKYIDRDLGWYATSTRTNTLYNSFNRFNFFNADAAHNFSIAATEKDASEALFSIILGPEYHYISERNIGTLERLRPEFNRLKEEMQAARQRQQRTARIIAEYKEPASLGQLREAILITYRNLHFKEMTEEMGVSLIEERSNQLRPVLNSLLLKDNQISSLGAFNSVYKAFEQKRIQLTEKETLLRELTEKQTSLSAEEKRLNNNYEFLRKCLAYLSDSQLMKLDGLQARESAANLLKSRIDFVKVLIEGIDRSSVAVALDSTTLQNDLEQLVAATRTDEAELNKMIESIGQLETVIRQLKSHGLEYLTLDHLAKDCPLCQAAYERSELERRISQEPLISGTGQSVRFDTLRQKIEKDKKERQNYERAQQQQRKLIQAFQSVFEGEMFPDLAGALERLWLFTDKEDQVAQELFELSELKKYALSRERSEKEFNEIRSACSLRYPAGPVFSSEQASAYQQLLDEDTEAISRCKNDLEETTAGRIQTGNEIKRLLGVEGTSLYLKDIHELIQKEEANVQALKTAFDKLGEFLLLDEDTQVGQLYELTETLRNNILSLREEQKIQFEFEMANKEHVEAKAFTDANQERLTRYEKAVVTLRELTGDEASAHISTFFKENFQEIVDIFKSIHVPKEFKTLKYSNDRLELITDRGDSRSISEISTGQRSALALSIFLSLNGKLANGPDIVLFDDPVAFIDDLNALSFLDHLRIHTLKAGKQVFFATANMRLAGLFEKKFGFLGDDFKKFPFDRTQQE